jgi:hypothetical protein
MAGEENISFSVENRRRGVKEGEKLAKMKASSLASIEMAYRHQPKREIKIAPRAARMASWRRGESWRAWRRGVSVA